MKKCVFLMTVVLLIFGPLLWIARVENKQLSAELVESQAENKQLSAKLASKITESKQLSAEVQDLSVGLTERSQEITALKERLWIIPGPEKIGEITLDDLRLFLTTKLSKSPDVNIIPTDNYFRLTKVSDWQRFFAADVADQKPYQTELFDCDDFATWLLGAATMWAPEYAFGMMFIATQDWSSAHAINFFISVNENGEKEIWFVEPQNDKLYRSIEEMGYSFVTLILV